MRLPALALFLSSFLLAVGAVGRAQAQSIAPPAVNLEEREAVRVFHNTYYPQSSGVALGFTGNAATYKAGTISTAFRTAALLRANYYRRLAGLNAVTESATFDTRAHEAAFLMWTGGDYLFYPPRWASPAWTAEAYEGASRSNKAASLPSGWGSGTDIDGFMQEEGEENLGAERRHWVLFPPTQNMGYGATPGASALYVRENGNDSVLSIAQADLNQAQSWPPRGFFPAAVPFSRWSWAWISQAAVNFNTASVSVLRNGTPVAVTIVSREGRLVWDFPSGEFDGTAFPPTDDVTYKVSIRGVVIDAQTRGFDYSVVLFNPTVPTTGQPPVAVLSSEEIVVDASTPLHIAADVSDGTIQWFKDDLMLPSQTRNTLDITAVTLADAGRYWIEVRNSAGLARSDSVDVVVIPKGLTPPSITAQPKSSTFTLGTAAVLSVTASSPVPMTYQWRKAGVDLPGRTLSRLEFSSITAADSGYYDVVVSNYAGSTTSSSALLSVLIPGSPPNITKHPTSASVEAGTKVVFSVTASSQVAASYQWRKGGVALVGKTTNTLEISAARPADAGSYDVVVSNAYGSVTSKTATLTVVEPMLPSISTQPSGQTIFAGSRAQFYVIASGPGTLGYQWRKDGVALPGETASVLVIPLCRTSDSGAYSVAVGNEYGSVTSSEARLSVLPPITPLILIQPASVQVTTGTGTTLTVEAAGRPTLTYQWRKNSVAITGATQATYSLTNLNSSKAGDYDVVVSNPYGSTTSNVATVSVRDPGIAPSITTQPSSQTVLLGNAATFSVAATGTDPLTYQWYKNAAPIANATASTYTIAATTLADAGLYSVTVTNLDGSLSSTQATLTVSEVVPIPEISTEPADAYVHTGDSVSFKVQASGTGLTYQWYLNDELVAGVTTDTFPAFNAEPYHDGWKFHCVITNSAGSVTTRKSVAHVWPQEQFLAWEQQPVDASTPLGGSVTFTGKAVGYRNAAVSYQWYLDEYLIPGATKATLEFSGAENYHFARYHVVASIAVAGTTYTSRSNDVRLSEAAAVPVIRTQPASVQAGTGSTVALSVEATSSTPLTYQWYKNTVALSGATAATYSIASLAAEHEGNYTVVVANAEGTTTSAIATVTTREPGLAPTITSQPASATVLLGSAASFSVTASGTAPLTYQWYKNAVARPGATAATYSIPATTLNDAGQYSVVVGNAEGSTTSAQATLTVTTEILAPAIVTEPADVYIHPGDPVSFNVQANGTGLTYQWYLDGTLVPGITTATFPAFNAEPYHDGWEFHCVISNGNGSVTTRKAVAHVWTTDRFLSWKQHPADAIAQLGGSAAFSCEAVGYKNASVSYQWYLNETPIPGATKADLTFSGVDNYHFTDFHVVASIVVAGKTHSLRSDNVWVQTAYAAPVVTTQPADRYARLGDQVNFSVQASGHPLIYQWYLNGEPVPDWTASSTPTFVMYADHNGWLFHCVVTNSLGSATTRYAIPILTDSIPPLAWGAQPLDVEGVLGGTATLSCIAATSVETTIAYQWYIGATLIPGATKSYLTITGLSDYHFTEYHVVATATVNGTLHTITSGSATIRQKPTP